MPWLIHFACGRVRLGLILYGGDGLGKWFCGCLTIQVEIEKEVGITLLFECVGMSRWLCVGCCLSVLVLRFGNDLSLMLLG
jgi:hypothetical protein